MNPTISIRPLEDRDVEAWLHMRLALWPEADETAHRGEMEALIASPRDAIFLAVDTETPVGFVEASILDRALGEIREPVGYLEGWYVAPTHQRRGIGRKLVEAAEQWARAHRCRSMHSDFYAANDTARAAHAALGYTVDPTYIVVQKDLTSRS